MKTLGNSKKIIPFLGFLMLGTLLGYGFSEFSRGLDATYDESGAVAQRDVLAEVITLLSEDNPRSEALKLFRHGEFQNNKLIVLDVGEFEFDAEGNLNAACYNFSRAYFLSSSSRIPKCHEVTKKLEN